ncbi:unnamed protein product [Medioppia subpectinata]|uniref:AB hydrolase-1 domain-containing protein n=1 Tax=Medioppia subpectinata TaxID=1979941 RepID=A0A7R9PYS2_9ACAR|nr:unnamed protein product [Medioppia subpectinata]CAG2105413.1 unnamed protein product [Medioppia subpectinata]
MLFIHGFPEFWYSWRHQMNEFEKDYHVIAVDNRGYGDTDKPRGIRNYTVDKIVDDSKHLLEALGKRDIVLVAHDWGGAIAWRFAAKYPSLLDKLIIINSPHPLMTRIALREWAQFIASWYMHFYSLPWLPEFALRANDYYIFDYAMQTWDNKPLLPSDQLEAYKYQFQKNGFTAPLNWYRAVIRRYPINNPKSTNDKYLTTPLAAAHNYVNDLTVKYIDNCSHWTQMEHPTLVNQYMREYLDARK